MPVKITVQPSGVMFDVLNGESILDAAIRHNINLPYGCRNAMCGTCKAKLISGDIDYGGFTPSGVNDDERAQGYILPCRALPHGDLCIESPHVTSAKTLPVKRYPVTVARMERLSHDVMRLLLNLPDQQRLQFFSGQYIDVLLNDGRRRSFSLANAPHDDQHIELHIRHVDGGEFTDYVFNIMRENDRLNIEGPFGSFYFREESLRPVILMAGGTGFAPIKGIVEHALAQHITRPLHLYWGVRAQRDLYLDALARQWLPKLNLRYCPVLSQPAVEDHWQGRTGFVHEAIAADFPDLSGFDIYMCGPPIMIHSAVERFRALGAVEDQLYSDAFEFAPK
ncbi:MAG: CDP-6-deoxy-delta-3,4-glucoseen reductase [Gammaproteobacteria bacterium]|nr:CDP-6-deoxy-delta-3,4-glucoseen reductase [Gammaproteobacteria bacterium]